MSTGVRDMYIEYSGDRKDIHALEVYISNGGDGIWFQHEIKHPLISLSYNSSS